MIEASVSDLSVVNGKINGIYVNKTEKIESDSVILTTGTFLGGRIHIGPESWAAGRMMRSETSSTSVEPPSNTMAQSMRELGFPVARLRTGTPPRLALDSVDFSELEMQESDNPVQPFHFLHEFEGFQPKNEQIDCFITHSNEAAHQIVRDNLDKLPNLIDDDG